MRFSRKDASVREDSYETPLDYYSAVRKGLREKADHNKAESQYIFFSIILFTLASPLFLTLSGDWFWGKVVPATLSVLAAAGTSWLQLRKPHRLWSIYRRAQRELERLKTAYDFQLDAFADTKNRDKLLVSKVSEIAFHVHEQWEGLVPEPEALVSNTPAATPQKGQG